MTKTTNLINSMFCNELRERGDRGDRVSIIGPTRAHGGREYGNPVTSVTLGAGEVTS